jgi:hypothetical protein
MQQDRQHRRHRDRDDEDGQMSAFGLVAVFSVRHGASAGPILLDPMQVLLPAFVKASGILCRSR